MHDASTRMVLCGWRKSVILRPVWFGRKPGVQIFGQKVLAKAHIARALRPLSKPNMGVNFCGITWGFEFLRPFTHLFL